VTIRSGSLTGVLALFAVAAFMLPSAGIGLADTFTDDDPLHGFCAGCSDNGTNTPISTNPVTGIGFTVSPTSQTGELFVDILIPNSVAQLASYSITGTNAGNPFSTTASLVSTTAWTTGSLAPYLGITASPNNSIGAFLPASINGKPGTQFYQPSATGYFVFQADIGKFTLSGPGSSNPQPVLNIVQGLAQGSFIVAFLDTDTKVIATANSGALFETGVVTPIPGALVLFGSVVAGAGVIARWRRQSRRDLAPV